MAGGVEYGLQILMPMILVRTLDVAGFGQYRLLWLLAVSALAIAPCFIPQSLFYLLPRASSPNERAVLFGNSIVFLCFTGAVAGLLTTPLNPWLPTAAGALYHQSHGLSALFIALWVVGSFLDVLPTADGKASWQARYTVTIAIFRTVALGLFSWIARDVTWVIYAMMLVVIAKLLMMGGYIYRNSQGTMALSRKALKQQLAYSAPFALWNAFFLLRAQSDQWVVAITMSTSLYAMFSIATALQPVSTLIRQPVLNAMMARLNAAFAQKDFEQARNLIANSNVSAAFFLVPIAGGLLVVAPELVRIVYTEKYSQTIPVMQVYIIGIMISAFAVSHAMPALNQRKFATINNAICLPLSIAISLVGGKYFGLPGAALGSVMTLLISELFSARTVAAQLHTTVAQLMGLRALVPTCLATLIAVSIVSQVSDYVSVILIWALIEKSILYAVIGIAALYFLGGKQRMLQLLRKDTK